MASTYALLLAPSANRVYAQNAVQMVEAELAVFSELMLQGRIATAKSIELGGVTYVEIEADGLTDQDLRILAQASSLFALFERQGDLLRPIEVERHDQHDDDLLTILKYVGKTNEHFTKLLLNVTAAAALPAERFLDDGIKVLDPMSGRGTTLNQALMYGWDASGIDVDKRDFEAYSGFASRWLKSKKYKHTAEKSRVRRDGKTLGSRFFAEFAADKADFKAGRVQTVDVVNGDTRDTAKIFAKNSFDLIVTDAPYGVQHGATQGVGSLARDPAQLIRASLDGWVHVLKPAGAIGISWNTKVTPRDELAAILDQAGLDLVEMLSFAHRVDQAIERDLIVARKPLDTPKRSSRS